MTTMTIFNATLVQDSALSISGLDRESTSDQPFTVVDGVPILNGRGLKGAAVAMARRFFDPLPRSISEQRDETRALCRSAWEVNHGTLIGDAPALQLRPGVGILQKTSARADGVLYDREVVPAGTRWQVQFRVDWRLVPKHESAELVEGILHYVLQHHWSHGRCWLGGGAARGLGWCHLEDLRLHRLNEQDYASWVIKGRQEPANLPPARTGLTPAAPTRSWFFATRDLTIQAGEYQPDPTQAAWGLDMLAVGPHSQEGTSQRFERDHWAVPIWASPVAPSAQREVFLETNRAIAMDGTAPLLPGSSLRGPLRHAFSRRHQRDGRPIQDPHQMADKVAAGDPAGDLFGTVERSSNVLIRDGRAEGEWFAARMHMHAEDELSAGSYGTAKRDAVRLLRGKFPVRIVVEGPRQADVQQTMRELDPVIELGALGHVPIGGHKTRGAGWGPWSVQPWTEVGVEVPASTKREPPEEPTPVRREPRLSPYQEQPSTPVKLQHESSKLDVQELSLGAAARYARDALGDALTCWWCEPRIDLEVHRPPAIFGKAWPDDDTLRLDEVIFFSPTSSWRAARTKSGWSAVTIREVEQGRDAAAREIPAFLHRNTTRFCAQLTDTGGITLREWRVDGQVIGFGARLTNPKETRHGE